MKYPGSLGKCMIYMISFRFIQHGTGLGVVWLPTGEYWLISVHFQGCFNIVISYYFCLFIALLPTFYRKDQLSWVSLLHKCSLSRHWMLMIKWVCWVHFIFIPGNNISIIKQILSILYWWTFPKGSINNCEQFSTKTKSRCWNRIQSNSEGNMATHSAHIGWFGFLFVS